MKPLISHALALALLVAQPVVAHETITFTLPSSCASKTTVSDDCVAELQTALAKAQKKVADARIIENLLEKEYSTLETKAESKNASPKLLQNVIAVEDTLLKLQENITKIEKESQKSRKTLRKLKAKDYSTIESDLAEITKTIQGADSTLIFAKKDGNDAIMQAGFSQQSQSQDPLPTAKQDLKKIEKRRIFLTALEAHPLFISSLSGSGASFSVNGQSNKITLRQTVKRSWDKAHNFSVAIGLNKTEDEDNKIVTRLDGFDSDWSFQGSYNYLGLLRDSQNDAHDIFGFAGIDVTKGRETVSYLDPATSFSNPAKITKLSTSNQPWSIAAHAGFALDNYSVRYKLMHKHGWDVNPKSTVCPAMPTNGHFTCTNIPVGVPDRKVFNVSAIDLRMSFKHWAFSPAFRYDHANRIKELVLPVHLPIFNAGNGKNLTAGLVPSWRSDDRWHLGIFAGSSFDLGLSE